MTSVSTVWIKISFPSWTTILVLASSWLQGSKPLSVPTATPVPKTSLLLSKWEDAIFSDRKWNNSSLLASSRKKNFNCLVTYFLPTTFHHTPFPLFYFVAAHARCIVKKLCDVQKKDKVCIFVKCCYVNSGKKMNNRSTIEYIHIINIRRIGILFMEERVGSHAEKCSHITFSYFVPQCTV